jgi:hypothetical protein
MGKFLRSIGILFLSISALSNLAGGAGTTCVALNPTKYEGFEAIANFQWLYFIFVIGTFAFGVMMTRAVVLIIKKRPNAYRYAMISLISAIVLGLIHIVVSRSLRGGSMPVDGVVYATILTAFIFLIFKIPGVWEKVDFTKGKRNDTELAGGAAAIVTGFLSLTIQYLMKSTHTINGVNYGDAFHITMTGLGSGLLFLGLYIIVKSSRDLLLQNKRYDKVRFINT